MTEQDQRDERPVVAITGVAGRLGRELARQLHRTHRVIGIDRRPCRGLPKDVEHYRLDLRRNRTEGIFRSNTIKAIVHCGILHNPRSGQAEHYSFNVVGLQRLLSHAKKYKVPKLIVLSTADVYGPSPFNATALSEEAPLMAAARFESIRDLVSIDMTALSFMWQHPKTETVVLRPVHIVGKVANAASSYLNRPWCPRATGFDPMVQLVHQDDVVQALLLSMKPGVRGVFNIDGPSPVPVSLVLRELGRKQVSVPGPLLRFALRRMWRLRLTRFPAQEVDHIQWPATVDGSRARDELGYEPRRGLREIFRMLKEGDPLMMS